MPPPQAGKRPTAVFTNTGHAGFSRGGLRSPIQHSGLPQIHHHPRYPSTPTGANVFQGRAPETSGLVFQPGPGSRPVSVAQNRKIEVSEKEPSLDSVSSEGSPATANDFRSISPAKTKQEKNYSDYVKHVQHQKNLIREQELRNTAPKELRNLPDGQISSRKPLLPEPENPSAGVAAVNDFQSWLIHTGKRLFKILG